MSIFYIYRGTPPLPPFHYLPYHHTQGYVHVCCDTALPHGFVTRTYLDTIPGAILRCISFPLDTVVVYHTRVFTVEFTFGPVLIWALRSHVTRYTTPLHSVTTRCHIIFCDGRFRRLIRLSLRCLR